MRHPALANEQATSQSADRDSVKKAWLRALAATSDCSKESQRLLPEVIDDFAENCGNAVALLSPRLRLSYKQLSALSNRYSRWALDERISVGDVVCLMMRNCPEYLAIWLGVTRVGGVVALVNPDLRGAALVHSVNIVAPSHVIADQSGLAAFETAREQVENTHKLWACGEFSTSAPLINRKIERYPGQRLRADERRAITLSHKALLIYTSGTTGRPKAANISHRRIITWSNWFAGLMNVGPHDRIYNCLPLNHSVGGVVATGALLVRGGSVVLREKFSAKSFWADVARTKCTLFQYIGELCRYLLKEPHRKAEGRHHLRLCCGNGLRADVWEAFQSRFGIPRILEFYAATESNFSLFNVEGRVGAIGRVQPFLAHRFPIALVIFDSSIGQPMRDSNGHCLATRGDEIGEAIFRIIEREPGAFGRFEGYLDREETDRKILRHVFEHGDAWFRTGDLMRRDSGGYYYFVDRIGDTFRWKGENVATLQIEDILRNQSGVRDASVYGVVAPPCEGKAGMATIVVDDDFNLADFRRDTDANLPDYARPVFLRLRDAIEATETFKPKKHELAKEGYNPHIVADPLFYFDRDRAAYVRLDASQYMRIRGGGVRL